MLETVAARGRIDHIVGVELSNFQLAGTHQADPSACPFRAPPKENCHGERKGNARRAERAD